MSWRDLFPMSATITPADMECGAANIVRQTVRMFSLRGRKIPHAMEAAAGELQLSPRKVRRLYNAELTRIRADEYKGLIGNFLRYLDTEAESLRDRAAQLEHQRALLEEQLCGDTSTQSKPGGSKSSDAALSAALTASSAELARAARYADRAALARKKVGGK